MEKEKKVKGKIKASTIILWVVYVILAAGVITSFFFTKDIYGWSEIVKDEMGNTTTIWHGVFKETVVSSNEFIQWLFSNGIPNLIKTIQIVVVAIALALLLELISKIKVGSKKAVTVFKLTTSFIKWVIFIAAIFMVLAAWGADTMMMLASAGVVTLIIGLGSQTLVSDIIAGMFIVFEGDVQIGDIVIIDGWRGEVVSIGIRNTKLIDAGGNIKIANNSEIKTIINQTKELSIAKCYVAISYEARIESVEAVIADNINAIKEKIPAIVEGPFYKGVAELAESSVNLLFVAKCKENDIYQVQRDLNREIKVMFDNNGIGIPFNQIVVHMGEDDKPKAKVSDNLAQKAQEFREEQKELSKDIEVKK